MREEFDRLDQAEKRRVHLHLCQFALEVWEAYIAQHGPIEYSDSVVGMHHTVDPVLPRDAFACAQQGEASEAIAYRYREPIVAMQDDDLGFPNYIELAYYAVYNLFRKYCAGATIDDWLIVNQALSASDDPALWPGRLRDALQP